MFEDKVLNKVFELMKERVELTKDYVKLHNKEFHNFQILLSWLTQDAGDSCDIKSIWGKLHESQNF
jgi:hypothetical protein